MRSKMKEAEDRLAVYSDALEQKYKNLRLKRFAVVSLSFERLWAKAYNLINLPLQQLSNDQAQ